MKLNTVPKSKIERPYLQRMVRGPADHPVRAGVPIPAVDAPRYPAAGIRKPARGDWVQLELSY